MIKRCFAGIVVIIQFGVPLEQCGHVLWLGHESCVDERSLPVIVLALYIGAPLSNNREFTIPHCERKA